MDLQSTSVALLDCSAYRQREIVAAIDKLCRALEFKVSRGSRVLLKPNLLSGGSTDHLACTDPFFAAGAAEWFVAQGAKVALGDSPAFGTAKGVMGAVGLEKAVAGLPVERLNFDRVTEVRLADKLKVNLARAALECDLLVNLPKVKAHSQLYMTLAVKNYFGTVVGFQKPRWHLRYGRHAAEFAAHLVDLLAVLPAGLSLLDGIVAMHGTGPINGQPFPLGLIGAAVNPVALDTAILEVLRLDAAKSPIWQECARRGLAGTDPARLDYPFKKPAQFSVTGFRAPATLKPVSFNPLRLLVSACRRYAARGEESA